jgi:hypothetical protein
MSLKKAAVALIVTAVLAIAASLAKANTINITINPNTGLPANDIDFGLLPNNDPTSNFKALVTNVGLYETFSGMNLSDPVFTGFANYENINGNPSPVSITGFDYAVLHYGTGPGGAGQGGGIVFYYLNGMTGNFTFPADGSGPNGFGGLSSIRLFAGTPPGTTPESGTTVLLLGVGLLGIGLTRTLITHKAVSR